MNYIADAKTKYFESKDHYLAMRKAFAEAVNNPDIHLKAAHFMFYNAIRGKDITCGFKDRTNLKKIYYQGWVNLGADQARWQLQLWSKRNTHNLLIAFGDTVDVDTARQVIADMPKIPQKLIFTTKPFDEWADEYVNQQLAEFAKNLAAQQTPLEPEIAATMSSRSDLYWNANIKAALRNALRKSATLISAGEFKGEVK